MKESGTQSPTERARELARRIATRHDDPEGVRDLIELMMAISDPHGNQDIYDAAQEAIRVAFSYAPESNQALRKYLFGDKKEGEDVPENIEDHDDKPQM